MPLPSPLKICSHFCEPTTLLWQPDPRLTSLTAPPTTFSRHDRRPRLPASPTGILCACDTVRPVRQPPFVVPLTAIHRIYDSQRQQPLTLVTTGVCDLPRFRSQFSATAIINVRSTRRLRFFACPIAIFRTYECAPLTAAVYYASSQLTLYH